MPYARSERTNYNKCSLITFLDSMKVGDVAYQLEQIGGGSKVLILTGVHDAEIDSDKGEKRFTDQDRHVIFSRGFSERDAQILDVGGGAGDADRISDAYVNDLASFHPDFIIWASCKSAQDLIIPGLTKAYDNM